MKTNFRVAIFSVYLFWGMLFFSICSIIGIRYGVDDTPPFYSVGVIVLVGFSIIALGRSIFSVIRENFLFTAIFPLFITLCFLYDSSYSQSSLIQFYVYYVAFCIPASYIGSYLAHHGGIAQFGKWLDIVMIICSLGVIRALPSIIYDSVITIGGASYQRLAYMSGFAFCINICGIFIGDRYKRFSFMQSPFGKVTSLVLLLVQLIGCFYSGGRGGFVYLVITSVFLFIYSRRSRNILVIIVFLLLLFILSTQFKGTIFYDVIGVRMERTFNFITEGGAIDTQNRNDIWNNSLSLISNNDSIFGYGLFEYYSLMRRTIDQPYAHNLFLELLLQGGILYFVFWVFILFHFVKRIVHILKKSSAQALIIPIAFYTFIELMFSNTYLRAGLMWFSLSYIFSYYKLLKNRNSSL